MKTGFCKNYIMEHACEQVLIKKLGYQKIRLSGQKVSASGPGQARHFFF